MDSGFLFDSIWKFSVVFVAQIQLIKGVIIWRQLHDPSFFNIGAEWQSGYAAACKAVDLGSIPGSASML